MESVAGAEPATAGSAKVSLPDALLYSVRTALGLAQDPQSQLSRWGPLIASSAKPTISRAGGERFSSRAAWCRTPERQGRRWRAAGLVDVARGRRRRDVGSALPMASRPQSIGIPDHRGAGRRRRPPPGRARARRRDLNGLAASVARTVAGLVASSAEDLGRVRRPGRPLGLGRPLTLAYHHVPASRGSGRSPSPATAAVSGAGAGPGRARLPSVGGPRRRGGRSGRGW
jgi:hypothetical protein